MLERGMMLPDGHGGEVFYPDPDGNSWRWGRHCFQKKHGWDYLYAFAWLVTHIHCWFSGHRYGKANYGTGYYGRYIIGRWCDRCGKYKQLRKNN